MFCEKHFHNVMSVLYNYMNVECRQFVNTSSSGDAETWEVGRGAGKAGLARVTRGSIRGCGFLCVAHADDWWSSAWWSVTCVGTGSWLTRPFHSHSLSSLCRGRGGNVAICNKELKYIRLLYQISLHDLSSSLFISYQTSPLFVKVLAHFPWQLDHCELHHNVYSQFNLCKREVSVC